MDNHLYLFLKFSYHHVVYATIEIIMAVNNSETPEFCGRSNFAVAQEALHREWCVL